MTWPGDSPLDVPIDCDPPPPELRSEWTEHAAIVARRILIHFEKKEFDACVDIVRSEQQREIERALGEKPDEALDKPLASMAAIDVRTVNSLERAGILTVGELCAATEADLRQIGMIGVKAVAKLRATAREYLEGHELLQARTTPPITAEEEATRDERRPIRKTKRHRAW